MISLSGVGLGLSLVLGCLLLAIVAELCYLLWWKKNISNTEIEDDHQHITQERGLLNMLCFNNQTLPLRSTTPLNTQELCSSVIITETHVQEPQCQPNKNLWRLKPFGGEDDMQNLWGPPRILSTIQEETKEDLGLESDDEKGSSVNRNLSDLSYVSIGNSEAFLTPLTSPPYFTPPLTPTQSFYDHFGFNNPLFGSSFDAEFNGIILRDVENRLYKERG